MTGYISMDKHKAAPVSDIVAILSKKGRKNKSTIISKKGDYLSKTSPRKLAERVDRKEKGCR